ncbi:MAG TPA: hypothetical protein VGJ86_09930 [Acidimicrobiales bacterium]|jgi:hypothetical protein
MGTSSAEPDRLEGYGDDLVDADDALTRLANEVDDAIAAFAAGAAAVRPTGFDPSAAGTVVRGLRDESRHLAAWVADVGRAFRAASRLGVAAEDLDEFISKRVGEPSIAEQEMLKRGREDAAELREVLADLGIDPSHFDPEQLQHLDPDSRRYQRLFELMQGYGANMWSEDYAVGFYDKLNSDGIRATVGVIETFAVHQAWAPPGSDPPDLGDAGALLLAPFVRGFALTTSSPDLGGERDALLHPSDEDFAGSWQRHQLSLLLSGPGSTYDPTFLATAADQILLSDRDAYLANQQVGPYGNPYVHGYPPMQVGADLWGGDVTLAVPQAIALRSLADNDDASWLFTQMDYDDSGDRIGTDHLQALLTPDTVTSANTTDYAYSNAQLDDLAADMQRWGANATTNALVDAVAADPSRYADGFETYGEVVRIVAGGDIPDPSKRAVANALVVYLDDIGDAVAAQHEDIHSSAAAKAAADFNRPDLVDFFQELGYDERAAAEVGQSLTAWAAHQAQPFLSDPGLTGGGVHDAFKPVGLVMGTVLDGFDATDDAKVHAYDGLATGVGMGGDYAKTLFFASLPAAPATGGASLLVSASTVGAGQLLDLGGDWIRSQGGHAAYDGNDIHRLVVGTLEEQMALAVADERGWPAPEPGAYSNTLSQAFPAVGDPLDYLLTQDDVLTDYYDNADHWGSR